MAGFYESLNKQNYLKAMQGSYANYGITSDSINNLNSQENINTSITLNDQIQSNINNAESATTEENHDDDGTWWDKTMNVVDNVVNNIFTGIFNFADGIGDFAMGVVGSIAGAVGNTDVENAMKQAINTDWQSNATQVVNATNKTLRKAVGQSQDYSWEDIGNQWTAIGSSEESKEQLNKVKYGNDIDTNVTDIASNIAQGVGQLLPTLGVGKIATGISTGLGATAKATKTANIVTQASLGAMQGMGSGYSTVAKEDGDLTSGTGYAAIKGLYNGAVKGFSAAFGTLSDRFSNKVADGVVNRIMNSSANLSDRATNLIAMGVQTLADAGFDATTEFGEELLDPVIKQFTYDQEALYKAYGDSDKVKSTLANAGISALTSALSTTIFDTAHNIAERPDYVAKWIEANPDKMEKYRNEIDSKLKKVQEIKALIEVSGENATDEMLMAYDDALNDYNQYTIYAMKDISDELDNAKYRYGDGFDEKNPSEYSIGDDYSYQAQNRINVDSLFNTKIEADTKIEASADADTRMEMPNDTEIKANEGLKTDTSANTIGNAETNITDSQKAQYEAVKRNFENEKKALNNNGIYVDYNDEAKEIKLNGKTSSSNDYLFQILTSKERKAMNISATFSGIGYTSENGTMTLDSNTLSTDDIEIVQATIDGLGARKIEHFKQYGKGGHTFDSYDNGVGVEMTANGKVVKVYKSGESPKWTDKLRADVDTDATSKGEKLEGEKYADADQKLTGSASEERTLNDKAYVQMGRAIDKVFDGYDIDSDVKKNVIGMVSNSYKLDEANNETLSKAIDLSADKILQSAQKDIKVIDPSTGKERNATLEECLSTDEVSKFKEDYAKAMQDIINLNGETTEKASLRAQNLDEKQKAQIVQNKLLNVVGALKKRTKLMASNSKAYATLRNKFQKGKESTSAGAWQDNPTVPNTIQDLAKTIRLSSNDTQFTVASVKKFISEHTDLLGDYSTDEYTGTDSTKNTPQSVSELSLTPSGKQFIESIKELNEYLNENPDLKTFDNEGLTLINSVLTSANSASSKDAMRQRAVNKSKVEGSILDARAIAEAVQEMAKKDNAFKRIMRNSLGQRYILSAYMGDGELGDFIIKKPIADIQKEIQFESLQSKYLEDEMISSGIKEADTRKEVTLTTSDDKTIKISKKKLYTLYMAEKTSGLSDDYEKNGITIYDSKTKTTGEKIKISQVDAQTWFKENLSENEMAFLDRLYTNFVNGSMAQEVGTYTKEKYGADVTEEMSGDYMPNSKDNLRHTLTEGTSKQSSLGTYRTIRRTKNTAPSRLLDFDEVLTSYAHDVGQLTRMDAVREYNSLINTKDSQGMSTYNYLSNALPDGKKILNTWQQTINQITDTKQVPKILGNAMGVKVAANLGSALKQPLDYLRQLKNVSFKDWAKGFFQGFKAWLFPSEHNELFTMLNQESASYSEANSEKWHITANSIAGNVSKFTEALSKPMEAMNDLVWAMAYKSFESKAISDYGYDPSTADGQAKIKAQALSDLDAYSTKTLSNSASYDMSNYRSGREGQIYQVLFSFWGDNQKNLENVHEIFTGNSYSRLRQKAQEKAITYKQGAVDTLQGKVDKLQELEDSGTELTETQQINEQTYKARIEGLGKSISRSREQIAMEIEYQALRPKRIAATTASLIGGAVASVMISHLNSYLKGNEDASEMKTGEYWIDTAKDAAFEAGTSWIPFIGTMTDAIRNNSDVSLITLDGINDVVDTISNAISYAKAGKITNEQLKKEIGSAISTFCNITGIPIYTVLQYAEGGAKNIMNMAGANGTGWIANIRGYNSSYLTTKASTAKANGNLTEATRYTQANMYYFKGNNADFDTAKEITRVGATISKTPDSITRGQKEAFNGFYKKATPQVKKLINSSAYKSLTDDEKKSAINYVYSAYYQASKQLISASDDESTTTSKSAKVLLSNSNAEIGEVSAIIIKCRNKKKEQALAIINRSKLTPSQKKLAKQLLGYLS